MASHSVHRVLFGAGALAGAATLETLLGGAAGGTILAGAAGGVGSNFLHQLSDDLAGALAKAGGIGPDFLRNEDLERLVGRTVAALLNCIAAAKGRGAAGAKELDPETLRRLPTLALKAEAAWLKLAPSPSLEGLNAEHLVRLFAMRGEEFAKATTLDEQTWTDFLLFLEQEISDASLGQKLVESLRTPLGALRSSPLSPDEAQRVATILRTEMPHALYVAAKQAFADNDPAFAALHLRLMRELMTDVRDVLVTVANTSTKVDDLAIQFRRLASAVQTRASQIITAAPQPLHAQLQPLLDDIQSKHDVILGRLDQIGKDAAAAADISRRTFEAVVAPFLHIPQADTEAARNRFVYRNQRITLVGRGAELIELHHWLDDERVFSWDLWTGPAGSGKSRLALELCQQVKIGWDAGFYVWSAENAPKWSQWPPERSTLIVFDYVAEHAKEIGEILAAIAARTADQATRPLPAAVKIRCLLLEREIVRPEPDRPQQSAGELSAPLKSAELEPPWLIDLRTAGQQLGDLHFRRAHRGQSVDRPERALAGVSEDAARAIIREEEFVNAGRPPSAEQVEERLKLATRVDVARRPLFIAMAAEAAREHSGSFELSDGSASFDALVDYIRDKEWGHARERLKNHSTHPVTDFRPWARLVCVATMCGGLKGEARRNLLQERADLCLPSRDAWGSGAAYRLIVSGATTDLAPPIEPDVLGEGFALWWLEQDADMAQDLIDCAWSLGMSEFVGRAALNFPQRVEASGLLRPRPKASAEALEAAQFALATRDWLTGGAQRASQRGQELCLDRAQPALVRASGLFLWAQRSLALSELDQIIRECDNLMDAARSDAPALGQLLMALVNAIYHAGTDTTRADELLQWLQNISAAKPEDAAPRMWLASGLTNAILHAGSNTRRTDELLNRLQSLADANPRDLVVHERLASALNNALLHSESDARRAEELLNRLQSVAGAHAGDSDSDVSELLHWCAHGFIAAIVPLSQDLDKAESILQQACAFISRFSGLNRARLLVRAFNNALYACPREDPRVSKLVAELDAAVDDRSDDPEVRSWLAAALYNAIKRSAPDDQRTGLLDRLQTLEARFPGDGRVQEHLAAGLFHFFRYPPRHGPEPDHFLSALRALNTRSQEPPVAEELARAITNALAIPARPAAEVDAMLSQVRALVKQHSNRATLAESMAKCLANAIVRSESDAQRAHRYMDELWEYRAQHLNRADIREWTARGLLAGFVHLGRMPQEATLTLERMLALVQEEPRDAVVLESYAGALNTAVIRALDAGADAGEYLNRFEDIAVTYSLPHAAIDYYATALLAAIRQLPDRGGAALLARIQDLTSTNPSNASLRAVFADVLFVLSSAPDDTPGAGARALESLDGLWTQDKTDEHAASRLCCALYNIALKSDPAAFDSLLQRLSHVADQHPHNDDVQECLSRGLFAAVHRAGDQGRNGESELNKLHALSRMLPDNAGIRASFAKALYCALHDCNPDSQRVEELLARLEDLARSRPDDATVREWLLEGFNLALHSTQENCDRTAQLLERLQVLDDGRFESSALRALLAKGLLNTFNRAPPNSPRADDLLQRLQKLADADPADAVVREQLAKALTNAIAEAGLDATRTDELLRRILVLADAPESDSTLQAIVFRGCGAAFHNGLQNNLVVVHALDAATTLVPRLPCDSAARSMVFVLIELVRNAHEQVPGPQKAVLDDAGTRLWAAYRKHFPNG